MKRERSKCCDAPIIRKAVWAKIGDEENFYPSAEVCSKCGKVIRL